NSSECGEQPRNWRLLPILSAASFHNVKHFFKWEDRRVDTVVADHNFVVACRVLEQVQSELPAHKISADIGAANCLHPEKVDLGDVCGRQAAWRNEAYVSQPRKGRHVPHDMRINDMITIEVGKYEQPSHAFTEFWWGQISPI